MPKAWYHFISNWCLP